MRTGNFVGVCQFIPTGKNNFLTALMIFLKSFRFIANSLILVPVIIIKVMKL